VAAFDDRERDLMADQADVEQALVALLANALYPQGSAAPSAVMIGNGYATFRIYRGMPNAPALDADLVQGISHVTVFPDTGVIHNVTRYPRVWVPVAPVPPSLVVSINGSSASFAGTCARGQLAGVAVDGAIFPYAVQANDSPPTVASNLAAQMRTAGWIVAYAGATLSVPGARSFTARVVNGSRALMEIKRQIQQFRVTLWCANPFSRDAAARLIDCSLAFPNFIALADGSFAHLKFSGSTTTDGGADASLYRRDFIYAIEYPTTLAEVEPAMLFGVGGIEADGAFIAGLSG
jgi:hypothetical protein